MAVDKPFAENLAKLSDGRINLKIHPIGVLGTPFEYLKMVQTGTVEFAIINPGFYADRLPLLTAFELAFVYDSPSHGASLFRHFIVDKPAPELQAYMQRYNIHPSYFWGGEHGAIQTVKPVRSIADLKGLKLRTMGGAQNYLAEAWGAVPIAMTPADVYPALQSGVLDGVTMGNFTFQEGFRWYEIANNFLVPTVVYSGASGGTYMNLDLWNSLPKEIQGIVTQASLETEKFGTAMMDKVLEEVIERMKAQGCSVIWMTEEQTEELRAISIPARDRWLKDHPEGKVLLEDILARAAATR